MIGQWLGNFIGYWFGTTTGGIEPDFLCKPVATFTYDNFTFSYGSDSHTMETTSDIFQLTYEDCPGT